MLNLRAQLPHPPLNITPTSRAMNAATSIAHETTRLPVPSRMEKIPRCSLLRSILRLFVASRDGGKAISARTRFEYCTWRRHDFPPIPGLPLVESGSGQFFRNDTLRAVVAIDISRTYSGRAKPFCEYDNIAGQISANTSHDHVGEDLLLTRCGTGRRQFIEGKVTRKSMTIVPRHLVMNHNLPIFVLGELGWLSRHRTSRPSNFHPETIGKPWPECSSGIY